MIKFLLNFPGVVKTTSVMNDILIGNFFFVETYTKNRASEKLK